MESVLLVACDDHNQKMVLLVGVGQEEPMKWQSGRSKEEREALIERMKKEARRREAGRIEVAYEASGQGYGFHDQLQAAGIRVHLLAPSKIRRSVSDQKGKTDGKDALLLYEVLRGHVLAGNRLPKVFIPDPGLRDERELVRRRVGLGEEVSKAKKRIGALLKRFDMERPKGVKLWSSDGRVWLQQQTEKDSVLGVYTRETLKSHLRQLAMLEDEERRLERPLGRMAKSTKYKEAVKALDVIKGVGPLLALVFLTEMGDVRRFENRRERAAYLGLIPRMHESGVVSDRKGHITKEGPAIVRKLLCQGSWCRIGKNGDPVERRRYEHQVKKNEKRKKIYLVAAMRRLALEMGRVAKAVWEKQFGAWPKPVQVA